MFLKDHLIETYQKASLEKNDLILENVINRWAHRFGIETMNELVVKEEDQDQINLEEEDQEDQDQINLEEEDQEDQEDQDQINLELLDNVQYQKEIGFNSKEEQITKNTEFINKDIYDSYKDKYIDTEELPLPNINTLRKWIKNEKEAS